MPQQLREVIDEILRKKSWVQADLADYIGVRQPSVSKMRKSDDWNLHWQAFVKLMPLCKELGIDPARELPHTAINKIAVEVTDAAIRKTTNGAKSEGKRKSQK